MAVAVNSETGYERQNVPEPTDCLWILQPSHVTPSHKNANVKRYAVATLPRTDGVIAHKWHTTRTGKPGRSAQTYFSFPSPAPLPNAHAHEEKLRLACETSIVVGFAWTPLLGVTSTKFTRSVAGHNADVYVLSRGGVYCS